MAQIGSLIIVVSLNSYFSVWSPPTTISTSLAPILRYIIILKTIVEGKYYDTQLLQSTSGYTSNPERWHGRSNTTTCSRRLNMSSSIVNHDCLTTYNSPNKSVRWVRMEHSLTELWNGFIYLEIQWRYAIIGFWCINALRFEDINRIEREYPHLQPPAKRFIIYTPRLFQLLKVVYQALPINQYSSVMGENRDKLVLRWQHLVGWFLARSNQT